MRIRTAGLGDVDAMLGIYAYYVENTAISFEYEVPTHDEFARRLEATLERYPYLVVEVDGEILGYTYAGPLSERAAYARSCELSVYVRRDARGKGYGRALYEELEKQLVGMGITNLYACIADPVGEDEYLTRDSERFHERLGFRKVGAFHRCGYKFGRWYNVVWMEKLVGDCV